MQDKLQQEQERIKKQFNKMTRILVIMLIVICSFPLLFTELSLWGLDTSYSGTIGDTIGGIMGPFIAIVAAFLTFVAFWEQFKANKVQSIQFLEQGLQFNNQANDVKIDRFENKYYEMLQFHRANVEDLNLNEKIKGRDSFVEMFNELKFCHSVTVKYAIEISKNRDNVIQYLKIDQRGKTEKELNTEVIIKFTTLSYLIFFFGISSDSHVRKRLIETLANRYDESFLGQLFDSLDKKFKQNWQEGNISYDSLIDWKPDFDSVYSESWNFNSKYRPFDGQQAKLGHYFRHLYQTVRYVIDQKNEYFTDLIKYSYIKTLRAQISDFEMLLLYYNGVSDLGIEWINEELFTEWLMIKNMPTHLASFGYTPEFCFKDKMTSSKFNRHIFGWDE